MTWCSSLNKRRSLLWLKPEKPFSWQIRYSSPCRCFASLLVSWQATWIYWLPSNNLVPSQAILQNWNIQSIVSCGIEAFKSYNLTSTAFLLSKSDYKRLKKYMDNRSHVVAKPLRAELLPRYTRLLCHFIPNSSDNGSLIFITFLASWSVWLIYLSRCTLEFCGIWE